ncbi:MAG: DUF86 domain-containing protein [Actinobacteria bacterium]|nr:DUF86 domain-containing protein [Actinomycetota bacterium]
MIAVHLERGPLDDDLISDAIRMRLIEVGEAVKDIDQSVLDLEPSVPWRDVAGMRDVLAHRYFESSAQIIRATVEHDLPALQVAVERLLRRMAELGQ